MPLRRALALVTLSALAHADPQAGPAPTRASRSTASRRCAASSCGSGMPLPVAEAGRAYEERRTDGCVVMSNSAFDRLSPDLRSVVAGAATKMGRRFAESTRLQDEQLLGGLFARQGVRITPPSPLLRAQFLEAARTARDTLGTQIVPSELLLRVQSFLADYRSERH